MMFTLAKDLMEKTLLWKIVRRMPKGALLHAHCSAMVDVDYLLQVMMDTPGMHMASLNTPMATASARFNAILSFCFKETPRTEECLWRDDYKPGTFVLITKAAEEFPDGGRDGFLLWLKSRCVISRKSAVEQHHGVADIWLEFDKCMKVMGSLLNYEPVFRKFLRRLMSLLVNDGVYWVELRYVTSHLCLG
jgi:adenosine deaminase CECR1